MSTEKGSTGSLREAIVARANQFNILMVPEPRHFDTLRCQMDQDFLLVRMEGSDFGTRGLSKISSHDIDREADKELPLEV